MKFHSTRNHDLKMNLSNAIQAGLAPDGGLFVPENFPKFQLPKIQFSNWPLFAEQVLAPFFQDDPLAAQLSKYCKSAFSFPIPIKKLADGNHVLELFHGPTCAFKDIGAQFLASIMSIMPTQKNRPRLVLVATSGDTGGAVAAAFSGKPNVSVAVLYTRGKISSRQEQQLTCWQENVKAFSVRGNFDDCQRIVKEAFLNSDWQNKFELISANSISLARLLPQMVYFAGAGFNYYKENKRFANFIVPTGNLGNAVAAFWARELGFPIEKIGLALNANRSILNYSESGIWSPIPTIPTIANAMDVGQASNFERLKNLMSDHKTLNLKTSVVSASDEEIRKTIKDVNEKNKYIICPHTATAFFAQSKLNWSDVILVSTAHPSKFEDIVSPIIKQEIEIPEALKSLLEQPTKKINIEPDLKSLEDSLLRD
jgi:threonine synthase